MNRQEWLDAVTAHLRSLPRQAMWGDGPDCAYENSEGLHCAIGFRIPNGHPGLCFRGDVECLLTAHPDLADLWGVSGHLDERFLGDLQIVHDDLDNWSPEGFNARGDAELRDLADEWELTYTPRSMP